MSDELKEVMGRYVVVKKHRSVRVYYSGVTVSPGKYWIWGTMLESEIEAEFAHMFVIEFVCDYVNSAVETDIANYITAKSIGLFCVKVYEKKVQI